MKDNTKLVRVFDRVKLSREREDAILANLLREEKEVANMKNTRKRRLPAAALAAAVLVVVLAGTAVAGGYFGRVDVKINKSGYKVTSDMPNITPECLSEEVLAATRSGRGRGELVFGSWSEAEEFIGLEIGDNPMLDKMAQSEWTPSHEGELTPEDFRRCTVLLSNDGYGVPHQIILYASYATGDDFEEGSFGVNVFAELNVKTSEHGGLPYSWKRGNLENVSEEKYVTPSGLEVTIVTQDGTLFCKTDGTYFQQSSYTAYFTLNNAMFQLETLFNEENASSTLSFLKQVLDAYE